MSSRPAQEFMLQLPQEELYWALLDTSAFEWSRPSTRQLGFLFEDSLPVAIEQVQAAYARLPNAKGKYIACGIQKDRLIASIADSTQPSTVAVPCDKPKFIPDPVDLGQLNLLHDEFEPPMLQRLRKQWAWSVALLTLFITIVTGLRLEQYRREVNAEIATVKNAQSELFARVLGVGYSEKSQPPEVQFLAELRRLRQTRTGPAQILQRHDAIGQLAQFLSHWPSSLPVQTESLVLNDKAIALRASLETTQSVQELADSLGNLTEWEVQQPQISSTSRGVQAVIHLKPAVQEP